MSAQNNLALFAVLLITGGCAYPEYRSNSSRYYGMVDPDQTVERRLRYELQSDPALADASTNVLISALNGTVTLSGAVPNEQTRQKINAVVSNTSGVAVVNDQLILPPFTPTGTYGRPARIYGPPPP